MPSEEPARVALPATSELPGASYLERLCSGRCSCRLGVARIGGGVTTAGSVTVYWEFFDFERAYEEWPPREDSTSMRSDVSTESFSAAMCEESPAAFDSRDERLLSVRTKGPPVTMEEM